MVEEKQQPNGIFIYFVLVLADPVTGGILISESFNNKPTCSPYIIQRTTTYTNPLPHVCFSVVH